MIKLKFKDGELFITTSSEFKVSNSITGHWITPLKVVINKEEK